MISHLLRFPGSPRSVHPQVSNRAPYSPTLRIGGRWVTVIPMNPAISESSQSFMAKNPPEKLIALNPTLKTTRVKWFFHPCLCFATRKVLVWWCSKIHWLGTYPTIGSQIGVPKSGLLGILCSGKVEDQKKKTSVNLYRMLVKVSTPFADMSKTDISRSTLTEMGLKTLRLISGHIMDSLDQSTNMLWICSENCQPMCPMCPWMNR